MELITVPLAIVAILARVKASYPQVNGVFTVVLAMLLGGLAGYFHVEGTKDVVTGVMLGLGGAVGTHTIAERIGGRTV